MQEHLMRELLIFADPSKRLHWSFLLSTLFIVLAYFAIRGERWSWKSLADSFWNRSGRLDLQLFLSNRVLRALVILPIEAFILFEAGRMLLTLINPDLTSSRPSSWVFAVFTLAHFVLDDGARFLQHLLMHKVSWLWEFHKIHHSATSLTPLTLYRVHAVELFLASARRMATALTLMLAAASLGQLFLTPWQILGVTGLTYLFNFFGSNLRHSNIPIRFGWLERLLISPYMHQIHHSADPFHHNKNFGVSLSIWDSLIGTLCLPKTKELQFGIEHWPSERTQQMTFLSALLSPFSKITIKPSRWLVSFANAMLAFLLFSGCDSSNVGANPPKIKNFSFNHLAKDLKNNVYGKNQRSLILNSQSIAGKALSCSSKPSPETWNHLKIQLKHALADFHRLEPLLWDADFESSPRNAYRQSIYDWPADEPCALDRQVLELKRQGETYKVSSQPQAKGLNGIQSLLYRPLQHEFCSDRDLDRWNRLPENERIADRCALIEKLARQVTLDIENDSRLIKSLQDSEFDTVMLQKVYDSLVIFIDKMLKDRKLGEPTGFNESCSHPAGTTQCAFSGEHFRSSLGIEALVWNYEGIESILLGSDESTDENSKLGFYGLLLMKNQKTLADKLIETVRQARGHLRKLQESSSIAELALAQTPETCEASRVNNDLAPLCTAWKLSKNLSDLVKFDLKAALLLQNVKPVEGDGD